MLLVLNTVYLKCIKLIINKINDNGVTFALIFVKL